MPWHSEKAVLWERDRAQSVLLRLLSSDGGAVVAAERAELITDSWAGLAGGKVVGVKGQKRL